MIIPKKNLKTDVMKFLNDVETCAENYNNTIPHSIEKFIHPCLSDEDIAALKNVYKNKFSKAGSVGRKYYDIIMAQAQGVCPICGTGTPTNLDHYLPQSRYPLLVVAPLNLIPSCKDCNFNKGTYFSARSIDLPLHPYFDQIQCKWLEVHINFVNDGTFSIVYYNVLMCLVQCFFDNHILFSSIF